MSGQDGSDAGTITGALMSTGGPLATQFGTCQLIALQFNLSSSFSDMMFKNNFNASIDGFIKGENIAKNIAENENIAVPEPAILALLCLGIFILAFVNKNSSL